MAALRAFLTEEVAELPANLKLFQSASSQDLDELCSFLITPEGLESVLRLFTNRALYQSRDAFCRLLFEWTRVDTQSVRLFVVSCIPILLWCELIPRSQDEELLVVETCMTAIYNSWLSRSVGTKNGGGREANLRLVSLLHRVGSFSSRAHILAIAALCMESHADRRGFHCSSSPIPKPHEEGFQISRTAEQKGVETAANAFASNGSSKKALPSSRELSSAIENISAENRQAVIAFLFETFTDTVPLLSDAAISAFCAVVERIIGNFPGIHLESSRRSKFDLLLESGEASDKGMPALEPSAMMSILRSLVSAAYTRRPSVAPRAVDCLRCLHARALYELEPELILATEAAFALVEQ